MDKLNLNFNFKEMDIGMKMTLGIATATAGAAMICVPNSRQKDVAALELYDRPFKGLQPEERRVAEFQAGYKRWNDFFQTKVFPITRQLPGAQTPILNPYKDQEQFGGQQEDDD